MKKIFFLGLLSFIIWNTSAQIYTVPGAQVQPAWVFPLWFEDGSGAKDTLYFCYDGNSGMTTLYDTIFGEKKEPLDSIFFQAYYGCALDSSFSAYKKITFPSPDLGVSMCFLHTQMPLTLRWDSKVFRSNSLPFPDQSPAPRAQGVLAFDLPMEVTMCSFELPLLMTDTTLYAWDTICSFSDSIVFEGTSASYLDFHVTPWTGILVGIDNTLSNRSEYFICPNPARDELRIFTKSNRAAISFELRDVYGNIRISHKIKDNDLSIKITDLLAGSYLAIIRNEQSQIVLRSIIVKQ